MSTTTTINRKDLQDALGGALGSLKESVQSFKEDAINRMPYAGSWTAGQVVDHLLKSYSVIETVNGKVADTTRDPLQFDEGLRNQFLNFDIKMQSPDFIIPDNKNFSKAEQLDKLQQISSQILDAAKELDLSKTCLDFKLPEVGTLTRAEWLYFVSYHTRRHVHQLHKIAAAIPHSQEGE